VVGSFARGALTCGDLDLVAKIDWHNGPIALPHAVLNALSLRHKGVSLYDGTPDNNSSLVAFDDAILIWDEHSNDWRSSINNIVPEPNAARFSRATDAIPFRPEQLACDVEDITNLLTLRDEGLITWNFTPFSPPPRHGPPTKHEIEVLELFAPCGAKTQLLLSYLLPYFHFHHWPTVYRRTRLSRSSFRLGDAVVSVGRPTVPTRLLNTLTTARLMLVPHMHEGSANGVWCIERGDLHPLTLAAERLKIWALLRDDGQLDFYERMDCAGTAIFDDSRSAVAIDLFTSSEEAHRWIVETKEDCKCVLQPLCLTPKALLSCIAASDTISMGLTDYALTCRGALALGVTDPVTTAALLNVLAR